MPRLNLVVLGLLAFAPLAHAEGSKPWPRPLPAPPGMAKTPGPWNDPADLTIWPNRTSNANSDPWLATNHDRLRKMRPRVLLLNFSNAHSTNHLDVLARRLIAMLSESSRYHGYRNAKAPSFLEYQIFKFVDLRDTDRTKGNSRKIPVKDPARKTGFNMKYAAYFSDEFAAHYAIRDPRNAKRFLRLDELVDGGYVHEVWFFESGATDAVPHVGSFEVVERKPVYDLRFQKVGNKSVQAGNGGDDEQPWTGRGVRIGCINASRGIGCFLESLAHGVEGNANADAIPYFSRYFKEFAGLDLDTRYKLPFNSLYGVNYGGKQIRYPDQNTMVVTHAGKEFTVKNYVAAGGNAHFPPNARAHYDLDNSAPVLSTIEDWRIGSGPKKQDRAKPWTNAVFRDNRDRAPDCMGPWLVYWRQNFPGLDNRQKDADGKPMKNWWPFLFY